MGYELHIFRKSDWDNDEESSNITFGEWLKYIKSDPELELNEHQIIKLGEDSFDQEWPGFCEWTAHPQHNRPWFSYFQGSIHTKSPDEHTVRKMLQIAELLSAKVQGDDLEIYNEDMVEQVFAAPQKEASIVKRSPRAWWRFW